MTFSTTACMAGWLRVSATMLLRCRACYAVLAAVLAMAEAQQPSQQQRASVPTLLPSVRSLQRLSGDDIDVAALSVAAAVGSQPHVVAQAERVAAELGATAQAAGLRIELRQEATLETQQLRDAHGAIGGEESYEITLTESGMTIAAPAPAGLFYGTRTALQLLRKAQHQRLPPLQIFDAPVSAYRGVMVSTLPSESGSLSPAVPPVCQALWVPYLDRTNAVLSSR
jgi:N-acetyl-beta-hexosaminidase